MKTLRTIGASNALAVALLLALTVTGCGGTEIDTAGGALAASGETSALEAAQPAVGWRDGDLVELTISQGTAVDWGFGYVVSGVPADGTYTLSLRTCAQPAGSRRSCQAPAILERPADNGEGTVRYGVDSSQYKMGNNEYTLALSLGNGQARTSATLRIVVHVVP
jgi:hypothetical protein